MPMKLLQHVEFSLKNDVRQTVCMCCYRGESNESQYFFTVPLESHGEHLPLQLLTWHCLLCWAAMSLEHTQTNIKHAEYGAWLPLHAKVGGAQQDAHSLVGGQAHGPLNNHSMPETVFKWLASVI